MTIIGTWHLEHAIPKRRPALLETLSANSSDIWILTETHDAVSPADDMICIHAEDRPKHSAKVRPGSR